jgi:DNA-binding NtrC family response regulator
LTRERVLLIDDDEGLNRVLGHQLRKEGFDVVTCAQGAKGLEEFGRGDFGVVVTDIQMPGLSGMHVLEEVKKKNEEVIVILITAYGTIKSAVEAMKMGAADYLTKPFETDELVLVLRRAIRARDLEKENLELRSQLAERFSFDSIIGRSARLDAVFRLISKVAPTDATVLLLGESGTGKELLARALHNASGRKKGPFVTVNCSAIPDNLMESELFGHVKGAFTGAARDKPGKFELARGGTIFLDEIGDLKTDLQAKLLRVLQEKEFERVGGTKSERADVRIVAATNKDLVSAMKNGEFREDLFYRLSVVPVDVPPLRDRKEDIPLLVDHFLEKFSRTAKPLISEKALALLERYDWPGNVRELENVIERAVVLSGKDLIDEDDLPDFVKFERTTGCSTGIPEAGASLLEIERGAILSALERTGWNRTKAAELLKIPRHVLLYRLKKFGIEQPGNARSEDVE